MAAAQEGWGVRAGPAPGCQALPGRGEYTVAERDAARPSTCRWHAESQRAELAWAAGFSAAHPPVTLAWTGVSLGGEETPGSWIALDLSIPAVTPPVPSSACFCPGLMLVFG